MRKRLSILAVLLLAVAISAYSVGGTYAKYTSTFNGTEGNVSTSGTPNGSNSSILFTGTKVQISNQIDFP